MFAIRASGDADDDDSDDDDHAGGDPGDDGDGSRRRAAFDGGLGLLGTVAAAAPAELAEAGGVTAALSILATGWSNPTMLATAARVLYSVSNDDGAKPHLLQQV